MKNGFIVILILLLVCMGFTATRWINKATELGTKIAQLEAKADKEFTSAYNIGKAIGMLPLYQEPTNRLRIHKGGQRMNILKKISERTHLTEKELTQYRIWRIGTYQFKIEPQDFFVIETAREYASKFKRANPGEGIFISKTVFIEEAQE